MPDLLEFSYDAELNDAEQTARFMGTVVLSDWDKGGHFLRYAQGDEKKAMHDAAWGLVFGLLEIAGDWQCIVHGADFPTETRIVDVAIFDGTIFRTARKEQPDA